MEYEVSTIASMKMYVVQMESAALNVCVVEEDIAGFGFCKRERWSCVVHVHKEERRCESG